MSSQQTTISWRDFASLLGEIAEVPANEVRADTRITEELGCDSFSLTELVLLLADDFGFDDTSLTDCDWSQVTVGQLYDKCSSALPGQSRERFVFSMDATT